MVDSCCAPGCQNRRGKVKGRAFYRIPKNPDRRNKWITAIKRGSSKQKKTERWDPTNNGFRLCSEHFISGKKSENPLSPDYVPSIFNHVPSPEMRRRHLRLDVFHRRQKSRLQRREQAKNASSAAAVILPKGPQDISRVPTTDQVLTGEPPVKDSTQKECEIDFQSNGIPASDLATPPCYSENCRKLIQLLELECQALRAENILLKEKMNITNEMSRQDNDKKVQSVFGVKEGSEGNETEKTVRVKDEGKGFGMKEKEKAFITRFQVEEVSIKEEEEAISVSGEDVAMKEEEEPGETVFTVKEELTVSLKGERDVSVKEEDTFGLKDEGEEERIREMAVTLKKGNLYHSITPQDLQAPTRRSAASQGASLPEGPSVQGRHLNNIFNVIGRPPIDVPVETIKDHLLSGFAPGDIAQKFGVSRATIQRRMAAHGLRMSDLYSDISDMELDNMVKDIQSVKPNSGYRITHCHLRSRGFRVQSARVWESLRRVNPEGIEMRKRSMCNLWTKLGS